MDWTGVLLSVVSPGQLEAIGLFFVTMLGSAGAWVFSLQRGFEGAGPFLRNVWPGCAEAFYHRLDAVIVIILGSFIGYILFEPSDGVRALAAGLGWVGSLNTFMRNIGDDQDE